MKQLAPQYTPQESEEAIYKQWEEAGAFTADALSNKEPYAISMPPPNATGVLHLGHALFLTIQDILIRAARMQGKEALWVPGTDHAAIATESVVIRSLQKEGMKNPRAELGRDKLVARIADYVEKSRGTIRAQIRRMGASCDWSRERYTLEPALNRCVNEVFKKMYDDGLIYRGSRIVNWDPKLQTTVSDDEVDWLQQRTPLYTLQYGPFAITTARPETKFGDKYVVMHPDDPRYAQYATGGTFTAEWINGPVTATVIKDEAIDPTFGTGVMTITPWHDAVDFAIAERHNLDREQIIDFDGTLLPIAEEFVGQSITAARPKIIAKLQEKGLLISTDEDYVHRVATNSRGQGVIEPQIKLQWFVDVNAPKVAWRGQTVSLKQVLQQVVREGDIAIVPKRFAKLYFHWIDNLRDWCISRQIWWGHRIPVWYKGEEVYVGVHAPTEPGWEQDPDTLDTWFSSAMWTWSTLLDKELATDEKITFKDLLAKSPDFKRFHPTTVLETGYDILFTWVSRMILMTTYAVGDIPFKHVLLHGLLSTSSGTKMSKSDPDSVIDPLELIEEYGADATRFGLMYQMSYGSQVIRFDRWSVRSARNFANKVWNVTRLLAQLPERSDVSAADEWIANRQREMNARVTQLIADFKLGEAAHVLHEFIWRDFADWYVEILKTEGSTERGVRVWTDTLKLLHPFMPHLTETLWQAIGNKNFLMQQPWPTSQGATKSTAKTEAAIQYFQDVVTTVRSARVLLGLAPKVTVSLHPEKPLPLPTAAAAMSHAEIASDQPANAIKFPLQHAGAVYLAAPEITAESIERARQKLLAAQVETQHAIAHQESVLGRMREKATPEKIEATQAALTQAQARLQEIERSLQALT